jgi:hypothetical protein
MKHVNNTQTYKGDYHGDASRNYRQVQDRGFL